MRIRLAAEEDDAGIARLLATTPMPGPVPLIAACGTSFFRALRVEGEDPIACIAEDDGNIVGVGASTARAVFIDGQVAKMRYLGAMRLAKSARVSRAIPRGFDLLRSVLASRNDEVVLTAILDDNRQARRVLEGARAGLPPYVPVASLCTYLIPAASAPVAVAADIERGADAGELAALLQEEGSKRNLFPYCRETDFADAADVFPGLSARDFFVVREDGRLAGALACWDTRSRRQLRVAGYDGLLRWFRPFADLAGRLAGRGGLPKPGCEIDIAYAALGAVRPRAAGRLGDLIRAVVVEAAARGCSWVAVTVDARDARRVILDGLRARRMRSTLYEVRFSNARTPRWMAEGPVHVEAALL